MWEYEKVYRFWENISFAISDMIEKEIPAQAAVLLLNNDSDFGLTEKQRKICLARLTSAKKIIARRWLPRRNLSVRHWLRDVC